MHNSDREEEESSGAMQSSRAYRSKKLRPYAMKKHHLPKQPGVVFITTEQPKKSRCFPCCCCCGPCIGSCLKWLFLCGSLCFCALVIGMVYIKSTRSCCGGRADTCLTYASIRVPDDYADFVSQFQGQQSVSMHKIGRALEICSTMLQDEGKNNGCYRKLLDCISDHVNPLRHVTTL